MTEKNGTENGKGGKPTSETRILACQCGSTGFDVKKRTKTSISLVCGKCGLRSSVKGNVATVRVRQQEIAYALEHTIVTPDDEPAAEGGDAPGEKVGDGNGPVGQEYITLRFRIMKGDQKDVIDKAMEACRVMNCSDDKFREQTWQGHSLEFICADFLSGCSADVLQIVEAMDESEGDAERIANEAGKKPPTARKIRDLRAKVRDKLAVESGILPADFFGDEPDDDRQLELIDGGKEEDDDAVMICPECQAEVSDGDAACGSCGVAFSTDDDEGGEVDDEEAQDGDEPAEEGVAEPEPVPDGGRLMKAVLATLEQYHEEAVQAGIEGSDLPSYSLIDGTTPDQAMLEQWTKEGGYLIRIFGDARTLDEAGGRACVTALVGSEPADLALDFSIEYDDATDDILGDGAAEVVELLPPDYDEVGPWNQPHFADRRETI